MQKRKHTRHAKKDQIKAKIKKLRNQNYKKKVFQRKYEKECKSPKSPKSRNAKNVINAKKMKICKNKLGLSCAKLSTA